MGFEGATEVIIRNFPNEARPYVLERRKENLCEILKHRSPTISFQLFQVPRNLVKMHVIFVQFSASECDVNE